MSHRKIFLILFAGLLFMLAPGMHADSLQLKNGNFVQGKYLGGTERAVQFAVNGKIHLYETDEILSISFGSASSDGGGIPSNAANRKSNPDTRTNWLRAADSPSRLGRAQQQARTGHAQEISWEQNLFGNGCYRPASNSQIRKAVCHRRAENLE
jgi:hypothetical protein